jgi:hypothetical protein
MHTTHTEAAFEQLSWHDCPIWRFTLVAGDPDEGDWTSDLVFDLDFIAEWICGVDGGATFRIAPATLVFHGVTDPKIDIDWGASRFHAAIHDVTIDRIEREPLADQRVYLDRPYYRWTIVLNWPAGGCISFGAVGFTQTLLAEPVLCRQQRLSRRERARVAGSATGAAPSRSGDPGRAR